MAVRVKKRIRSGAAEVQTSALLNTSFEAETPQLLVPMPLAAKLDLWLKPC